MDGELVQLLRGVVPPLGVAIPLLLAAWRPWRRHPPVAHGAPWGVTCSLALGFVAAFGFLRGWSFITPAAGMDWLPYLGVAAGLFGLGARRGLLALHRTGALALAASWAMLANLWHNRWEDETLGLVHIALSAAVITGLVAGLVPLAAKSRGALLPLALTMVCSVAGYVLFAGAHGASLGQLAGALAVVLGLCTLLGFGNRNFTLHGSGGLVVAMLLGGLLLNGYYSNYGFEDAPLAACGLLAVAPLLAWVEQIPGLARQSAPLRGAATLAAVAVPLLLAARLAWQVAAASEYGM